MTPTALTYSPAVIGWGFQDLRISMKIDAMQQMGWYRLEQRLYEMVGFHLAVYFDVGIHECESSLLPSAHVTCLCIYAGFEHVSYNSVGNAAGFCFSQTLPERFSEFKLPKSII